jgi:hypothetical protein
MTPKEKAEELIYKFNIIDAFLIDTKQCALIAVNEIIKELDEILEGDERTSSGVYYLWEYYKEVKQEIENL